MATQAEIEAIAVAKEVAANKRRIDAGLSGSASDYEHAANIRAQAAGFANAAEQEIDANKRAVAAGFKNAAEQEIDANKRAVKAGFKNAAEQEIHNLSKRKALFSSSNDWGFSEGRIKTLDLGEGYTQTVGADYTAGSNKVAELEALGVAKELEANERARLDGYESAVHKEIAARDSGFSKQAHKLASNTTFKFSASDQLQGVPTLTSSGNGLLIGDSFYSLNPQEFLRALQQIYGTS